MENNMKNKESKEMDLDNIEEAKELLEYAVENHSWPMVEDALLILKEELGYEVEDEPQEEE
jgi:hypothetical protein